MPVDSTHPEYDASANAWLRARDVIAGEDAVKAAGTRYLPRLDSQSDEEFAAYKARAAFYNATARTAEGYVGLIFRRPPFVKLPSADTALGRALAEFQNDADMLGTGLVGYAKSVVNEVIAVGRAGTLVDWEGEVENRVYASLYPAETILNWHVERINGRNLPTMVVLYEPTGGEAVEGQETDPFLPGTREQIRVLRLVEGSLLRVEGGRVRGDAAPAEPSTINSQPSTGPQAHGLRGRTLAAGRGPGGRPPVRSWPAEEGEG